MTLAVALGLSLFHATAIALEFTQGQIGPVNLTVAEVDLQHDKLQLFLHNEQGQPLKRFDHLAAMLAKRGQSLVFAMNAGMFHQDFSPVGLFVADGVQLTALNTHRGVGNFFLLPNGVLVIDGNGARVLTTDEFGRLQDGGPGRMVLATQSGPMLLIHGRIHPAFKPDSVSRLIRNGVCARTRQRLAFVIADGPLNFYEFARFFRDKLGCQDALYLDGHISSLYAPALQRNDGMAVLGPMIGVVK
jgi:uncharacterized protein YigE (DUF2233 family)